MLQTPTRLDNICHASVTWRDTPALHLQANSHTRFIMVTDDSLWHYVTSVNNQAQSLPLAVACAELGVAAGSRYIVTEVSGARYGVHVGLTCSHVSWAC